MALRNRVAFVAVSLAIVAALAIFALPWLFGGNPLSDAAKQLDVNGSDGAITASADILQYGVPVNVSAPAAAESIDE